MANIQTTILNKIMKLQDIVKNVIRSNQLYKTLGFLEATDLNSCITYAESIYVKLQKVNISNNENENINILQDLVRELSTLISLYGCDTLENLIHICIGHNFSIESKYRDKYNLLNKYVKPVRYKILDWRTKLKPVDDAICKTSDNFECFDFTNDIFEVSFQYRIYGLRIAIHNMEKQHTLIIYGIIEDIMPEFIENKNIINKSAELYSANDQSYARFFKCLTLKDLLIYTPEQIQNSYLVYKEAFIEVNKKSLSQIIHEFGEKELYEKRNMLIMLLVNSAENECHYLAYLLYDLLSNDINGMVDTYEQTLIYDSLPYNVKKYFRDVMKEIVNYTSKLTNVNIGKISLEQRICLMKTSDVVKEKAMVKLKEVKMKSEDTGSKAMQFLDGLLKIPFEIYKEEPVLKLMNVNIKLFAEFVNKKDYFINAHDFPIPLPFPVKNNYTSLEIQKYLPLLQGSYKQDIQAYILQQIHKIIGTCNKVKMAEHMDHLKNIIIAPMSIKCTGKSLIQLRQDFIHCINECLKIEQMTDKIYVFLETIIYTAVDQVQSSFIADFNTKILQLANNNSTVNKFMLTVADTLDNAVFGHMKAKRQIERIIGQWINGDISGYCFGFEGPPGVGKTSLAKKGIARCLLDENGVARPFAFIAMGGSTNSSTLDGHNYTYVGSTWGRIVDILMDTKIMNPIIFIDELDKVSKTENGKEIIGILTHLIDQTQNDAFQDKYFNEINLNLSKALFIFSYNYVDLILRQYR